MKRFAAARRIVGDLRKGDERITQPPPTQASWIIGLVGTLATAVGAFSGGWDRLWYLGVGIALIGAAFVALRHEATLSAKQAPKEEPAARESVENEAAKERASGAETG